MSHTVLSVMWSFYFSSFFLIITPGIFSSENSPSSAEGIFSNCLCALPCWINLFASASLVLTSSALMRTHPTFMHITKVKKFYLDFCFLLIQSTATNSISKNKRIVITLSLVSSPTRYFPAIPAIHARSSSTVNTIKIIFCLMQSFRNTGYIFTTMYATSIVYPNAHLFVT